MKNLKLILLLTISAFVFSCSSDDDTAPVAPTPATVIVETFNLTLSTENEIPAVPGRFETGTATLTIFDNNTLEFTITVNNLNTTDTLTAAHLHSGGLVETGSIIVGLVNGTDISFNGNTVTGTIAVTDAQINTIRGANVYLNVHSTLVPSGLVRSQLDQAVFFSKNISLSPANEVPAVAGRFESGVAYIRVTEDDKLYYRVDVDNLATTDAITMGHIHTGTATQNGSVLVDLGIAGEADLGVAKMLTLTVAERLSITGTSSYVNIHSTEVASGLLRGQMVD